MIEGQGEQGLGRVRLPLHQGHLILRKEPIQNLPEERVGVRRELRRLEDRAVAGGEGRHQRPQREVDGVVPGADDEHHALGLLADGTHAAQEADGGGHAPGLHPAGQVAKRLLDLGDDRIELREVDLFGRFPEVRRQGRLGLGAMGHEGIQ